MAAQLVLFDPEVDRGCSGNCSRIGHLAEQAFSPEGLTVSTINQFPVESDAPEPDIVVLRVPARRRLQEVLEPLRKVWQSASVIAAVCNIPHTADLMRSLEHGLDDFFCCPFPELDLLARLHRLLPEERASRRERSQVVGNLKLDPLVGESRAFLRAIARIPRVAASSATVLIGGETGVGKELFARAIHYNGDRKSRPFIPVNCSAVPDQLFENELFGHVKGAYTDAATSEKGLLAEANGGTVFLDEVDMLAPASQGKLLRFLQDREYRPLGSSHTLTADARIITASNANLRELVAARQFREDLFHRLNILSLHVPPLRERTTDIPLLARHFLARYSAQYGRSEIRFSSAALRKMVAYAWPGNVRELEGLLHRAVVFLSSDVLEADDIELPIAIGAQSASSAAGSKDHAMEVFERNYLTNLLVEHRGNVSRAARAAGKNRRTFQRLLRKHGIERLAFQGIA